MLGRGMRTEASDRFSTRREMLRRTVSAGVVATAGAGLAELFGAAPARALTPATTRLPATMILNALPTDAPAALVQAIENGCCIQYTRDENHCSPDPCPSGQCCYHIVSTGCDLNETICIDVSCAEGNFSTGC